MRVPAFHKGICPKVNVLELAKHNFTNQHVNYYTTGIL